MPKLKRINARIESDLEQLVRKLANLRGVSMSEVVVEALKQFCGRETQLNGAEAFKSFSKAGLIGCFKGSQDLSRNYKRELASALQNKWPSK